DVCPESPFVHRQRRHDRGRWIEKFPRRPDLAVGSQRRPSAGTSMIVFTDYLWFNTKNRQEFVRITDDISTMVTKSGVKEGTVLVSAMHITAGVYVNDWED